MECETCFFFKIFVKTQVHKFGTGGYFTALKQKNIQYS